MRFLSVVPLVLLYLACIGPARAATECLNVMAPVVGGPVGDLRTERPCPDALLAGFFAHQPPPPEYGVRIVGFHRYRNPDDGAPEAVVEFRLVPPGDHGFGADRRVCPEPEADADMQIQFIYDREGGRWIDLDSRGGTDPATVCDTRDYWTAWDIADFADPPHFAALSAAERGTTHDVTPGPERRAILDAVRQANADLNDRVPIVFIVDHLRSDGRHAYFRGQVRLRDGGGPVGVAEWGVCEQDPRDAVLEALLEWRQGRWVAVKSNRCADDVLLSEEEMRAYHLLVMEE